MTNISKPIVFFGTEEFSAVSLTRLIETGYSIAAIVTKPDSKKGRGQKIVSPTVKKIGEAHHIPVLQPTKLSEITDTIQALDSPVGILVSFGKIIPQSIIDLFSPGIINVHPSLLPLYRGPSPIESAIKNGDDQTGVSIMQLSADMDAGPLYIAKQYTMSGTETQPELYHTLATLGTDLLLEILPQILAGNLQPTPQYHTQATYCQLLTRADGHLDPQKLTATEAERRVRAFLRFPRTRIHMLKKDIIITKAHVSHRKTTELDVEFKDRDYLSIDELIGPSGKTMQGEAFLKGYLK